MEKKLKSLFEYQRFEKNASLDALIQETECRMSRELSDDELFFVNAAGDNSEMQREPDKRKGPELNDRF